MTKILTLVSLFTVLIASASALASETEASKVLSSYQFRPYLCIITADFAKDAEGKGGSIARKVHIFANNENDAAKDALNKIDIGATKDSDGNTRLSWAPNWGGVGSVSKIDCHKLIQ